MAQLDLVRKRIVITGGSSGIGLAAARALAKLGAQVTICGRSEETRRRDEEIGAQYHLVDYADLSSVRRLARALLSNSQGIDLLVNNAGAIYGARKLTVDGHEMTLQVNHLAGHLLTHLLHERLVHSRGVVINTSSLARFGSVLSSGRRDDERRARQQCHRAVHLSLTDEAPFHGNPREGRRDLTVADAKHRRSGLGFRRILCSTESGRKASPGHCRKRR